MEDYGVGLDIGSNSVGWCVVDSTGRMIQVRHQYGLGVRKFRTAVKAVQTRLLRIARRRYKRRRARLKLLEDYFKVNSNILQVDPTFFERLHQSSIHKDDIRFQKKFRLFSLKQDKEYQKAYPTIYHLRWKLMTEDKQFDIREVYLAMHHIVKYRGNFLMGNKNPQDFNFKNFQYVDSFRALNEYFGKRLDVVELLPDNDDDISKFKDIMLSGNKAMDRKKELSEFLKGGPQKAKIDKNIRDAVANLLVGYKAKMNILSGVGSDVQKESDWSFSLNNLEDDRERLESTLNDDDIQMLEECLGVYNAISLTRLIPNEEGFSASMVEKYNLHRSQLRILKKYAGEKTLTEKNEILGKYADYLNNQNSTTKNTQDYFYGAIKEIIKPDIGQDDNAKKIADWIEQEIFLPKQRTSQNGSIPYQIHQGELDKIIENQGKYYPWLMTPNPVMEDVMNQQYKLDELVSFHIPYFVGPLITAKAQTKNSGSHFSWMVRKQPGTVNIWNFNKKVDQTKSAIRFIQRMKTPDTYLLGEEVLPKCSLLYQEYMVLNELNNIRINKRHILREQKEAVLEGVFKNKKSVSVKEFKEFLVAKGYFEKTGEIDISGLSDPKHFTSGLTTHYAYRKILGNKVDRPEYREDLEKIVNWTSLLKNDMLRQQIDQINWLSTDEKNQLAKVPLAGWGRFSRKLLTGLVDNSGRSIIDQLRWQSGRNFMAIINEKVYAQQIESMNEQYIKNHQELGISDIIDNLYTSPSVKKGIREVLGVVRDIEKAMGKKPKWIFVEDARDPDIDPKRSQKRAKTLLDIYKATAKNIVDDVVKKQLEPFANDKNKRKLTEKMTLYFMQNGQDLYGINESLNFDELSSYQVDHIISQSKIKDDSFDNKVLTQHNQDKGDNFALSICDARVQANWKVLNRAGLISNRKLANLEMTNDIFENKSDTFANRQLVETRQIIRLTTEVLSQEYNPQDTLLVSVREGLSHQLRQELSLPKIREVNDYHHAMDAALAARIGMYMVKRYPDSLGYFVYGQYGKDTRKIRNFNFIRDIIHGDKSALVDPKTKKLLWDKQDIRYFKGLYEIKHMLVTDEVYNDNGGLFNQTIQAAKEDKKNGGKQNTLVRRKQDMPTELYGGHIGSSDAYMCILRVFEKKEITYWVMRVPKLELEKLKRLGSV